MVVVVSRWQSGPGLNARGKGDEMKCFDRRENCCKVETDGVQWDDECETEMRMGAVARDRRVRELDTIRVR